MNIFEIFQNRKYNRNLERMGLVDKSEIRLTAVGWRPDASYQLDLGNARENILREVDTPSRRAEYYRVIRKGRVKE